MTSTLYHSFRCREYTFEKPKGCFRIGVVGDSYIYGQGVAAHETLPAFLEQVLNKSLAAPYFQVINLSKGGLSIHDMVPLIDHFSRAYDFDLILLNQCLNDAEVQMWRENFNSPKASYETTWQSDNVYGRLYDDALTYIQEALKDRSIPLIVYHSLYQRYDVTENSQKMLAAICKEKRIPYLCALDQLDWLPDRRQWATETDHHPSAFLHMASAMNIARFLGRHGFISRNTETTQVCSVPETCGTDLSNLIEIQHYCRYKRDGGWLAKDWQNTQEDWQTMAAKILNTRQMQVFEKAILDLEQSEPLRWDVLRQTICDIEKSLRIARSSRKNGDIEFLQLKDFRYIPPKEDDPKSLDDYKSALLVIKKQLKGSSKASVFVNMALWYLERLEELFIQIRQFNKNGGARECQGLLPRIQTERRYLSDILSRTGVCRASERLEPQDINIEDSLNLKIKLTLVVHPCQEPFYVVGKLCGYYDISTQLSELAFVDHRPKIQHIYFDYPLPKAFSLDIMSKPKLFQLVSAQYRVNHLTWNDLNFQTVKPGQYTTFVTYPYVGAVVPGLKIDKGADKNFKENKS